MVIALWIDDFPYSIPVPQLALTLARKVHLKKKEFKSNQIPFTILISLILENELYNSTEYAKLEQ